MLSEEVLPNGDVITEHTRETTILASGTLEETQAPPSYSAGIRIKMDYDSRQLGGFTTRKLTTLTLTLLQLDTAFDITYLEYRAGTFGTGWTSDGKMHVADETTGLKQVTTITYNSPIISQPNFVKYTPINSDVVAGTGVYGKFNYRRGNGTILTYNFNLGW